MPRLFFALSLILLFFCTCVCAQTRADTLRQQLAVAAPEDSNRLLIALQNAYIFNDTDSAEIYGRELLNMYRMRRDTPNTIRAVHGLSVIYAFAERDQDAIDSIDLLIENVFSRPPYDSLGKYYGVIMVRRASALSTLGRFAEAEADFRKALANVAPGTSYQRNLFNNIGRLFNNQERYDSAVHYLSKSLDIARRTDNKRAIWISLTNMGQAYNAAGRYREALGVHRESLDLRRLAPEAGDGRVDVGLANVCVSLANLRADTARQQCHRALAAVRRVGDKALERTIAATLAELVDRENPLSDSLSYYLELAYAPSDGGELDDNYYTTTSRLADLLLRQGNNERALRILRAALADQRKRPFLNFYEQDRLFLSLARAEYAAGDPDSAAVYLDRGVQLARESFARRSSQSLAEAQSVFEVQESALALERERSERRTVEDRAAANVRLFLLGGVAALLLLLAGSVAFFRSARDRRTIERSNARLAEALVERDTLLREIHHRVKNNLQIISGLLHKQARTTTSEAVRASLVDGQDRLQAMALVHQTLYEREAFSRISVRDFVVELTTLLRQSRGASRESIELELAVADVELDMDRAIPVGLVLNELITNAYKYAFAQREGWLRIAFREEGSDQYSLTVEDNGRGMPEGSGTDWKEGVGLRLVRGLARQLEGVCEIGPRPGGGTRVQLVFSAIRPTE